MLDRRGEDLTRLVQVVAGIEHVVTLDPSLVREPRSPDQRGSQAAV
jgi:hypothetical protein